jgi:hypothetical protein
MDRNGAQHRVLAMYAPFLFDGLVSGNGKTSAGQAADPNPSGRFVIACEVWSGADRIAWRPFLEALEFRTFLSAIAFAHRARHRHPGVVPARQSQ